MGQHSKPTKRARGARYSAFVPCVCLPLLDRYRQRAASMEGRENVGRIDSESKSCCEVEKRGSRREAGNRRRRLCLQARSEKSSPLASTHKHRASSPKRKKETLRLLVQVCERTKNRMCRERERILPATSRLDPPVSERGKKEFLCVCMRCVTKFCLKLPITTLGSQVNVPS